jgi:enoyl-CoA hydratase/carnithine racemase
VKFNRDPALSVAIITGIGEKAFCAGADIGKTVSTVTSGNMMGTPTTLLHTFKGAEVWKPVISAVNGYCLGAGAEILVGTDIRVAAEHATIRISEVAGRCTLSAEVPPGCRGRSRGPSHWTLS